MKFLFLWLFAIVSANTLFAQKQVTKPNSRPDSVAYYMRNDKEMAYSDMDAKFLRLLIKADSGMFKVNDYYMDGTTRLVAQTAIDNIVFEPGAEGLCLEYFGNGKRKSIKYYNKGKLVGDEYRYYHNGNLYTVVTHSPDGIYLKQCLDSAGVVLADNGNGKWLKIGNSVDGYMEGPVVSGKEDGEWKRYILDSAYTIGYKQGNVISGAEYLKLNNNMFEKAEQPPSFPGGDAAFGRFLVKHIKYPEKARKNKVEGKVILTFVVEKDGSLTNIHVIRGPGSGLEEESLRVLGLSPKWKPGITKGRPVRVQYAMPINFALQEYQTVKEPQFPKINEGLGNYN